MPPSLVATIFLRRASACVDALRRLRLGGRPPEAFRHARRAPARTPLIRSTAYVMSPSEVVELHGEIQLRLAVFRRVLRARIGHDAEVSWCRPSCPWSSSRCTCPAARADPAAPPAAVAAAGTRGGFKRIDQVARGGRAACSSGTCRGACRRVEDLDLQVAEDVPLLLVVGDHALVGRIRADERGVAVDPSAAGGDPLDDGLERAGTPTSCASIRGVSARSGVMSSMIQMPRPCVARTRS